jgi:predicted nucleic-acid-binding protein
LIALDTNILIRLMVRDARTTYTFDRVLSRQEGFSLLG